MQEKQANFFKERGVSIPEPQTVFIDDAVRIGSGTTIMPFCVLRGFTTVGCNCFIDSFCQLNNAVVMDGAEIRSSRVTDSTVGQNATVGPNAHLRQNSAVGDGCRIGNFVELKNSVLGQGTKASHLAYVGDATVGKNCNIGCGAVFVNFDGRVKHRTVVGDIAFIGSNCNLIAPLEIEGDCFIACGTTVTKNVSKNDFVIGRSRETIKPDTANKYLKERD